MQFQYFGYPVFNFQLNLLDALTRKENNTHGEEVINTMMDIVWLARKRSAGLKEWRSGGIKHEAS